jgi:dienelactone hydrolase
MPYAFVDLMKEKIKKPASWFTTIFYKPLYILRVIGMIIPVLFNNRESKAKPRIFNFFRALRISPPPFPTNNLKLGAAGFCWGGRYTILLCGGRGLSAIDAPEPLIDCGFTAHPSLVSVPKDIEAVKLPLSVAVGNEDSAMKGPLIQQMKEILEKKKDDHECVIMPGAKHGFAVRIDPKDAFQNKYAEQAEGQAVDWFSRWFG